MGFFDRFIPRKTAPAPVAAGAPSPAVTTAIATASVTATAAPPVPATSTSAPPIATGVKPRLGVARERLELKDLPGALAVYEELLANAGDRADVLVTISGDLGSHGHVAEIIELIAPRYDAERHGPATGLNLLQAYLAIRDADAAQHILDILYTLNRSGLEDRLHGFSNAIAELIASPDAFPGGPGTAGAPANAPKVGLITVSKPIWFYGLEPLAPQILPPKEGRLRRIAFAQLALTGYPEIEAAARKPEDELGRLSRAIPLWLAETFHFSTLYTPVAAIGVMTPAPGSPSHYFNFGGEWTLENLRQLVETSGGLDYIFTGAVTGNAGDFQAVLRVWEVKTFRERKSFKARWTPATADAALTQLHTQIRAYMEWSPAGGAFAYTAPVQPRAWLETLGASLGLFVAEKQILPLELVPPVDADLRHAAEHAASGEAASFAYLTLRARAQRLGLAESPPAGLLVRSELVAEASRL
jgi:hypothetical protein